MTRKRFIKRIMDLAVPVIQGQVNGYCTNSPEGCLLMRALGITEGRNGYSELLEEARRHGLGHDYAYRLARRNDVLVMAMDPEERLSARRWFTEAVFDLARTEGIDLVVLLAGGAA